MTKFVEFWLLEIRRAIVLSNFTTTAELEGSFRPVTPPFMTLNTLIARFNVTRYHPKSNWSSFQTLPPRLIIIPIPMFMPSLFSELINFFFVCLFSFFYFPC